MQKNYLKRHDKFCCLLELNKLVLRIEDSSKENTFNMIR